MSDSLLTEEDLDIVCAAMRPDPEVKREDIRALLLALLLRNSLRVEAEAVTDDAERLEDIGHGSAAYGFRFRAENVRQEAEALRELPLWVAATLHAAPGAAMMVLPAHRRLES